MTNKSPTMTEFSRYDKFMEIHVPVPESEYMIRNPNLEPCYLVHWTYNSLGNRLIPITSGYDYYLSRYG